MNILYKKIKNIFKKKKIIVFNDTRIEKHYGCYSVMQNLIDIINPFGKIIYYHPVGDNKWEDNNELLKKINIKIIKLLLGKVSFTK